MNREIKFRAYIKNENKRVPSKTNKIVEVKSLHLGSKKAIIGYSKNSYNYGNYSISFDDIELMQYTGLHDENGKEIYEGDIVSKEVFDDTKPNYINKSYAKVVYIEELAGFYLVNKSNKILWEVADDKYNIEVVSTIYDNPELLGGE